MISALLTGLLLIVLLALLAVVVALLRRGRGGEPGSLLLLTQAMQASHSQAAVVAEKLGHLEAIPRLLGETQVELRGLAERVGTVETGQRQAQSGIATLGMGVAEAGTLARGLTEAAGAIREELSRAKQDLTALQSIARARQDLELRTAESIRRLEAVIAGTQSKGAAGENILELAFARMPVEWQVRDFKVGNKAVEFGLRLPNSLILPIDSKWAATALLEEFVQCEDQDGRTRLRGQIEQAVLAKAKEVRKYIHPSLTVPFGVAAVPDAVYELCWGVQVEVLQLNVVLVSYSLFVPYLLLVFQMALKTSQTIDLQNLDAHLRAVQSGIDAAQAEIQGRFSRAVTMLANSRDELTAQLGRAGGSLASLQASAQPLTVPAEPDAGEVLAALDTAFDAPLGAALAETR